MKFTNESTYESKGKNIIFKYIANPTVSEKMKITDDITNGVINERVGYEPLLFDYFAAVALVDNLTDIELPSSFSESAEFIERTHLLSVLKDCIFIEDILDAAKSKIEFKKTQIANSSKLDELFGALTILVNKYSESFDGLDINDVVSKLQSVNELAKIPKDQVFHSILKYEDLKKQKKSD